MNSGERLRIAVFSDSALPVLNGVSISIDALTQELRRQGHSVHLYSPRFAGYQDPDPNTFRFRSLESPISKGYPVAIPPFYRMLRRFREQRYDVIHTHTPYMLGMVGYRWAESHDIPIVSTYHTLYDRYAHYFRLLPRRYVRYRIAKHTNFYYNRVDHVITPTEASLKWLRRHSVTQPVTVIPTGLPPAKMLDRSEVRHRLGIPPEQRILLYVGRLAREKNLNVLFEAAARALHKDSSLRFWLVGDGPYRSGCIAMARELGIGDRVRFVGFVDRSRVDEYYAAADLFVFASITETQGLVIQEAMTHGLPAVVVAGGGASAAIEEGATGLLTKNDASDLADHIQLVLGDEMLYARLSDAAAKASRTNGIPAMTSRVVEVYRQVISEHQQLPSPFDLAGLRG
ncbi:MAG TPA: glycosyltransferase [Fimbriimonas sp.]|nr:glycosyltransferase [Fimbriimonas sp.]